MSVSSTHALGKSVKIFWFFFILVVVLGAVLRLYLITEQIILGDAWHGMTYVINNSFSYLFTHASRFATCIPMNLYRWFLLKSFGWSETILRLPPLIAGIAGLVVFPILLKKIFNQRVTIIFAFMFAISPFLIFYSRFCRPYSIVTLFGFLSVLAMYLWAVDGGRKYAVLYVVASVLSIYFHLFAAVVVLTPFGYVFLAKLIHKLTGSYKNQYRIVPGLPALAFAGASIAILLSVLILPALILSSMGTTLRVGQITFKSLVGFACMLSGTANKPIVVLFLGLLVFGQALLLWEKRLLGGIFFSILAICFATLVITMPLGIRRSITISRYVISVFPLSYVLVALGVDRILRYFQSLKPLKDRSYSYVLTDLIPAALLLVLFFSGPLTKIYAWPNNFTNHVAFQESYEPIEWKQAYTSNMEPGVGIAKKDIPYFYQHLCDEPDDTVVIEYPMEICGDYNFYYFYQNFHEKDVIVGYITRPDIIGYIAEQEEPWTKLDVFATAGYHPDHALSRICDTDNLEFENMVDMMDIDAIRQSQAEYIILHKNLRVEMNPFLFDDETPVYAPVIFLSKNYTKFFGPPVYKDYDIIVFEISNEKSSG